MAMISQKAMLASLTISQWSARKLDRKITDEVNRTHAASSDAGRYNKLLIATKGMADITAAVSSARNTHQHLTLPWANDGARILSAALYDEYTATMRKCRADFERARDKFVSAYPEYVDDARIRLNGMFNPADYPEPSEIARRFAIDVIILPVPTADDFRVMVGDAEAARIRSEIEKRAEQATADAMGNVWKRVHETVSHMAERLATYQPGDDGKRAQGTFRDSLVSNVAELARILPALNVTGNPELNAVAADMVAKLTKASPGELRENENARKLVADAAKGIADRVGAFMS